ncbi:hypothetical protein ACSETC_31155 [Pseudomonas aeruginosa]
MNKALDLLREIRPSIPKEVLELWCKDRDAFLASHPAVEQADASSCQGTNCGTTTGDHSSECLAEAAASQGWELKPGDLCGRDCPVHPASGEQAGGERWDALQSIMEWTAAENIPDDRKLCLIRNAARASLEQPSPAQARSTWPKLEKPAQVGAVRFSAGVSSRLVVEAAQRLYEFESTPEKEAERIERLQAFREQCFEPLGTEFSKVLSDNLPDLLSTAQAEQAEAERPEVVGYLATAEHPKHGQPHKAFNYFKDQHDAQVAHWRERGCTVTEDRLMTVSQHERIVGALRSEIAEWQEAAGRSRSDVVAYIAERAKLLEERDAAQARVAGLEAELETERMRLAACGTAALGYFDGCADAYKSASLSDVLRLRGDCDAALARVAEFEAQAQHSVPVVTPEMVMAAMAVFRLDVSPFKSMEAALIAALRKAAAPGKEGV